MFDLSVLTFADDSTRVSVDVVPAGLQACEVVLRHELGAGEHARAVEEPTRRSWTNTLALLERELFPRRISVHL